MSQKQFAEFRKRIEEISVNEKNRAPLNFVWEDQKKRAKQFKWFNQISSDAIKKIDSKLNLDDY